MTRSGASRTALLIRIAIAAVVFSAVTAGAIVWSLSLFDDAKDERIERANSDDIRVDSIYSDRIESRFDADYDRTRYRTIAENLASDPIYVDAYQAWAVTDPELDTLRDELDGSEVPVYVAFMTLSDLDDADGEGKLVAARIAREPPEEKATVLVVGGTSEDVADKGIERRIVDYPLPAADSTPPGRALDWVRVLKQTEVDEPYAELEYVDERGDERRPEELAYPAVSAITSVGFGLVLGVPAAILLVWVVRRVRSRKGAPVRSGPTGGRRR
ncbi:hypothetical protein IOD13_02895 [Brevibacterium casei]|nr:hypothetical protein [Brevibacterium casei]